MIGWLIFYAFLILVCVGLNNASSKIGMPVLLAFILLGIIFGNCFGENYVFDNYGVAEKTCTIALIFIMFYGGFGTSWKSARKIAGEASVLATAGDRNTAEERQYEDYETFLHDDRVLGMVFIINSKWSVLL